MLKYFFRVQLVVIGSQPRMFRMSRSPELTPFLGRGEVALSWNPDSLDYRCCCQQIHARVLPASLTSSFTISLANDLSILQRGVVIIAALCQCVLWRGIYELAAAFFQGSSRLAPAALSLTGVD